MRQIVKDQVTPIHQQLEDWLLDEISSSRLAPGDQVMSEQNIARQFGVSRTTVRVVYDRLVARGILTRSAGKGTFVAFPQMIENISLLVGFSEKMNAAGISPTTRLLGLDVKGPSPTAAAALRISEQEDQVVEVRRLRLLRGIPFVLHTAILPYPRFKGVLDYDLEQGRMTDYLQTATGHGIDHAEETISAYAAAAEESRLLNVARGFPMLSVTGVTYDSLGSPIRYSVARYHSSMVRLKTAQHRNRQQGAQ
ncbi:MAG: GntR family transcriptional regulator [Spirochaetaceae bacterium]|nr:MAG: GntR family transcriptional regulator [Spirochaetaceae bacterium]